MPSRGGSSTQSPLADRTGHQQIETVASPGFVAKRGKDRNYVMGHSWRISGLGAATVR